MKSLLTTLALFLTLSLSAQQLTQTNFALGYWSRLDVDTRMADRMMELDRTALLIEASQVFHFVKDEDGLGSELEFYGNFRVGDEQGMRLGGRLSLDLASLLATKKRPISFLVGGGLNYDTWYEMPEITADAQIKARYNLMTTRVMRL